MKKTVKIAILTIVAAIGLAGCGQPSGQSNSQAGSSKGNAQSGSGADSVTLKFWYPGSDGPIMEAVKEGIDRFEQEHAGIQVELTAIPWDQYFQKLAVAYTGGTQPDIHGLGFGQLISTANQDKYLDLQPWIEAENWEGQSDFFPDILKAGQWQGGQYGLLIPDVRPLAWRKDFFAEAGLDPDKAPENVEQLFAYADQLKVIENNQTVRSGLDIQTSNGEQSYLSLLLLYGQNFYDESGNPTFDSPVSIALVERLLGLYESGVFAGSHQQQAGGSEFVNSRAAMSFISSGNVASLLQAVGEDQLAWALPPAGPEGARTSLMLGTFLTAAKATKHQDEAWAFLKYWFSPDNMIPFSTKTGQLPPLQSIREEYLAAHPDNEVSYDALNDAQGYLSSELWAINVKYLRLALEEAFNGVKPAEKALKDNAELAREEAKSAS